MRPNFGKTGIVLWYETRIVPHWCGLDRR